MTSAPRPNDAAALLAALDELERVLQDRARNPGADAERYAALRRQLVEHSAEMRRLLPSFVRDSSHLNGCWRFLSTWKQYKERDRAIADELAPLRRWLEGHDQDAALPDPGVFLHTVRKFLEAEGKSDLAAELAGTHCTFNEWDDDYGESRGSLIVTAPVERLPRLNRGKQALLTAARQVLPAGVPFCLEAVSFQPVLEAPPDEEAPLPRPAWQKGSFLEHDGLPFRSKTETRIYDALKKRNALFFVNATAVLGAKVDERGRRIVREPDFLVCFGGKWGILEVMGEQFHPAATAMRDHDRARLFDDYGVRCIHFYPADRCYKDPEGVVEDFLRRLEKA